MDNLRPECKARFSSVEYCALRGRLIIPRKPVGDTVAKAPPTALKVGILKDCAYGAIGIGCTVQPCLKSALYKCTFKAILPVCEALLAL